MGVESFINPYPGLRPFEFPERHLFFGREGQSEELSRRLQQSRFLAVVGTSGSGKSSLVRAGLLPALYGGFMAQAGPRWRVAILRPGNDPIRNLAAALDKPAVFGGKQEESPKNLLEEALIESNLRVSSLGLLEYLRKAALPQDENLLIVVDQFEELFRFKKESQRADADDEAAGFVKLLLEAMRAEGSRVYVVITMRSDFLGDCAQFRDLPEAINDGQYLIPRMTREQLRQAIVAPAKVYDAQMTTRLVNRLLNDIGDNQDQLPILQHALMRTWDEWVRGDRPAGGLDFAHYEAIGGMTDALSRHADEAYEELGDERRKKIAERLFKSLTETDRDNRETRRRTTVNEVCAITKATPAEVVPVVDTFRRAGRTFIMPPPDVPLDEDSLLDISHESLIRNWKKLASWVKEEARSAQQYRRLVDAAELHEAGEIGHWRDPQLSLALKWRENEKPTPEWARRYHPAFAQAMRFLDESKTEQEQEQAREKQRQEAELEREREHAKKLANSARRLRRAVVALVAILLLSLGLAAYALVKKKEAYDYAKEAQANAQKAALSQQAMLQTFGFLSTERDKLAATKSELQATNEKLVGRTQQLETQEKELQTALKIARDERKRAEVSETKMAAALKKQEELTVVANAAKDRAEKTLEREGKNRTGLVFFEKGELNKANAQFTSLLDEYINDKELTPDERIDNQWWALHNLGAIYGKLEDYDRASEKYNQAVQILGEAKGERRRNLIATLRKLGQLYGESGNHRYGPEEVSVTGYRIAEGTYRELLAKLDAEDTIKKDDPRYEANVKREFADILYILKQDEPAQELDEPEKLYQEALRIYETYKRARNTSEIINILKKLAEIAMQQNPADAEAIVLKALKVREVEAQLDPTHPDIAESYSDLARVYQETGEPELAQDYGDLAGDIRDWAFRVNKQKSFPPDKLAALANSYSKVGRCDKAEKVYLETLHIIEENHRRGYIKDSSEWVKTLLYTAFFYVDRWRNEQAGKYFAQYIDKSVGAGVVDFNDIYVMLGEAQFLEQQGNYTEAELVFTYLSEKFKETPGISVPALSGLARSLEATNKQAEAEAKYREAIDLARHYPALMVEPTSGLANIYHRRGEDREAEEYFKRALTLIKDATTRSKDLNPSLLPYQVQSLIKLGKIEERKSPNAPGSPAAIQYFEQALSALDGVNPRALGALNNRYFTYGFPGFTADFHSDRADVLEALAKHLNGERAADLRRQAEEARQEIKAAKDRVEEARKKGCAQGDPQ